MGCGAIGSSPSVQPPVQGGGSCGGGGGSCGGGGVPSGSIPGYDTPTIDPQDQSDRDAAQRAQFADMSANQAFNSGF